MRRSRDPRLLAALSAGTVALVALIAVLAFHSSTTASPPPAPTFVSGTPGGVSPADGVGVLDRTAGLAKRAVAPLVGAAAPDFGWQTLAGHQTLQGLRGHAVLLEFFAPWCPQCQHEVPEMNGLWLNGQAKSLQVLAISASPYGKDYETSDDRRPIAISDLLWFRQRFGATYPMVFDPGSRVFNLYGYGQSYPTYFVIDAKGRVRFTTSTAITDADLSNQVRLAL